VACARWAGPAEARIIELPRALQGQLAGLASTPTVVKVTTTYSAADSMSYSPNVSKTLVVLAVRMSDTATTRMT
jgi:hypothetical protein